LLVADELNLAIYSTDSHQCLAMIPSSNTLKISAITFQQTPLSLVMGSPSSYVRFVDFQKLLEEFQPKYTSCSYPEKTFSSSIFLSLQSSSPFGAPLKFTPNKLASTFAQPNPNPFE